MLTERLWKVNPGGSLPRDFYPAPGNGLESRAIARMPGCDPLILPLELNCAPGDGLVGFRALAAGVVQW